MNFSAGHTVHSYLGFCLCFMAYSFSIFTNIYRLRNFSERLLSIDGRLREITGRKDDHISENSRFQRNFILVAFVIFVVLIVVDFLIINTLV